MSYDGTAEFDAAQEAAAGPAIIVPTTPIERKEEGRNLPVSLRMYTQLEAADPTELQKVNALRDTSTEIYAPIGGVLLPGDIIGEEQMASIEMADLVPVPKEVGFLYSNQIPLMVYEQPADSHVNDLVDFGTMPELTDIFKAIRNPPKEREMVLATPAQPFIERIISDEARGNPNLLNDWIYNDLYFVRRDWCEKDTRFIQFLPYIVFYKKVNGKFEIFVYQRGKGVGESRLAGNCSIGVGGHINPQDFLSVQGHLHPQDLSDLGEGWKDLEAVETHHSSRVLVEGFWSGILRNVYREGDEEVRIMQPRADGEVDIRLKDYIQEQAEQARVSPEVWLAEKTAFFLDYQAGDVDKVHLGMFIGIEVPEDFVIITNEEELVDVGFVELDDISRMSPFAIPSKLENWTRSIIDSLAYTLDFAEKNPDVNGFGSSFIQKVMQRDGIHPLDPEHVSRIPKEDRWKIGTLSQIFGLALKFYAMNAFIRA